MIKKVIIFDLDGVLIDTKTIHYECLNNALSKISNKYLISEQEHVSIFDGLSTHAKLDLLSKNKGLPEEYFNRIWKYKQEFTLENIGKIKKDKELQNICKHLKKNNYLIACCSNSIKKTVYTILCKLEILKYFDLILSNEDVANPKPHPEIYWVAASKLAADPNECLIIEDSPKGLTAAQKSGFDSLRVKNRKDLNLNKIMEFATKKTKAFNTTWQDPNLNVLIPMAGAGSRFEKSGYTFPKPLIDIDGKPMIQVVVNNLNFDCKHIFITQKSHRDKYNLDSMLNLVSENCSIVETDGITEGAACTTLLAKDHINNSNPLIIANSDQFVEWNTSEFMYKMQEQDADCGILTFESTHPKWSFVKLDNFGCVIEVAEKKPISNIATVGIYYWKRGSDYVKYAEQMIRKNIRHNNEFYVCPVFNEAIKDNKKIKTFNVEKMWGLGTPEDLNIFLKR